jgi:hypothetical protein
MYRFLLLVSCVLTAGCVPGLVAEDTIDGYGLINGRFACEIESNLDDDVELGEEIGIEWGLKDCDDGRHTLEGSEMNPTCVDLVAVMTRNDVIRQCSQAD